MNPYLTPFNTNFNNEMSNSRFQGTAKSDFGKRVNHRAYSADHNQYANPYASPQQNIGNNMYQSGFTQENFVPTVNNYHSNKNFTPEKRSPFNNSNQKQLPESKLISNKKHKLLETIHLLDRNNQQRDETEKGAKLPVNLNDVAGLVQNKDVYKLYTNQNDVVFQLEEKIQKEKKRVEEGIDKFLREFINMIDKLKEGFISNLDNFQKGLIEQANLLWKRIENFLNETIVMVNTSDEMSSYKKLKNNLQVTNDPIKAEIDIYNLRKQEASKAENLYINIKKNYDHAKINQLKSCLSILIEPYNKIFDDENFNRFFVNFSKDINKTLINDQSNLEEKYISKLDIQHISNLLNDHEFINEPQYAKKNYGLTLDILTKINKTEKQDTPSSQENLEIRIKEDQINVPNSNIINKNSSRGWNQSPNDFPTRLSTVKFIDNLANNKENIFINENLSFAEDIRKNPLKLFNTENQQNSHRTPQSKNIQSMSNNNSIKESIAYNSINSNLNAKFMENSSNEPTYSDKENIHKYEQEENGCNISNFDINQNNNISNFDINQNNNLSGQDIENLKKNYKNNKNRPSYRHSSSVRNNQKYNNNNPASPYYSNEKNNHQLKVNYVNKPLNISGQSITKSYDSNHDNSNCFVKKPPLIKSESLFMDKKKLSKSTIGIASNPDMLLNKNTIGIASNPEILLNKTIETPEKVVPKSILTKTYNNFLENSEKKNNSYKKSTLKLDNITPSSNKSDNIETKPQGNNRFINPIIKPSNNNQYITHMDVNDSIEIKPQGNNRFINPIIKPSNNNQYITPNIEPRNSNYYSNKIDKLKNNNLYMNKIDDQLQKSKQLYNCHKNGALKKPHRNSYTFSNPGSSNAGDSNMSFGQIKGLDFMKNDSFHRPSYQSTQDLTKYDKASVSVNRQEVILDKMVPNPKIFHRFDVNQSCFILCVRFINDNHFAISCDDNKIRVYCYSEIEEPKIIKEINIGYNAYSMISIKQKNVNNQGLPYAQVCGGAFPRNVISIYSLSNIAANGFDVNFENKPISQFLGHSDTIRDLIFVPSADVIISCSNDASIRMWDLLEGVCQKTINIHSDYVNTICQMSNGKTLLSGSNDFVQGIYSIENTPNGADIRLESKCNDSSAITLITSFYNNSEYALAANTEGKFRIWNVKQRVCLHTIAGHDMTSLLYGVFIITCAKEQDIYVVSFAKNDKMPKICNIDSSESQELFLYNNYKIDLPKNKFGNPIMQIIDGQNGKGFNFCIICDEGLTSPGSKISFFVFK